ncbi:MAG: GAF domain-containing protein [Actinomycetota bacterium]|nr:GAF domain-containing protein [Actinomycetota bacterium]
MQHRPDPNRIPAAAPQDRPRPGPGGVTSITRRPQLPPALDDALHSLAGFVGPLADFFRALAERAAEALGVSSAEVLELTPEGFVSRARHDFPLAFHEESPLGHDTHAGWAVRTGETVSTNYVFENRFPTDYLRDHGIKSGVTAAIDGTDGSSSWGVLAVHGAKVRDYSADEILFVEKAADLAAAFVRRDAQERARLREEEDRVEHERRKRRAAEYRLGCSVEACQKAAVTVTTRAALETLARHAVPSIADWCFVDLVPSDAKQTIVRVAVEHADVRSMADEWAEGMLREFPLDYSASYGTPRLLATGRPCRLKEIDDGLRRAVARDNQALEIFREIRVRSYMAVPLEAEHGRVGAIGFYHTTSDRRFTPEDVELAQDLARALGARLAGADRSLAHLEAREHAAPATPPLLPHITHAEKQVLDRLAAGMIPRDVAELLNRSERTVRNQIYSLNAKFNKRSYKAMVDEALFLGIATPDDPA